MRRQDLLIVWTLFLGMLTLISGAMLVALVGNKGNGKHPDLRLLSALPKENLGLKRLEIKQKRRQRRPQHPAVRSYTSARAGLGMAAVEAPRKEPALPGSYRSLEEIEADLLTLESEYSDLIRLEQIGESTAFKLPIWAVKVSDNAMEREDEPRLLFTGVHHAREPIGALICLDLIRALAGRYNLDPQITEWVDNLEVWFIPMVNPDGYKYILDNNLSFPWWRKNLRDNNRDGVFDPTVDGVDLNRNYDYNWADGGDGKPGSWFYRGSLPFSEKETQAIRDLALRENFIIGISYHSYGESILFPWGNYSRPPDLELIIDIASNLAARIEKVSGRGNYSILPLNGRVGQSSIWMYGKLRVFDYIVEVATEYFPSDQRLPRILREHRKGAFYLFERALGTGISGRVYDANSGAPLLAEVEVKEVAARHVNNRTTDPEFGSFYQLLKPGTYTLEIRSSGYYSKTLGGVRVERGEMAGLDVGLYRVDFRPATGNN